MNQRTLKISALTATLISLAALAGTAAAEDGKSSSDAAPHRTPGGHYLQHNDVDGNGQVTIDEARQVAEERFAKIDSNGDGYVTPEEGKSAAEARHAAHTERRGPLSEKFFELRDENKDGQLSKSELSRMPEKVFDEMDTNDDGQLSRDEFEAHSKSRMARHGERFFERMDVTGDGKISVDEAIDAADRFFERLDANGDEIVTAEEASAGRPPHARGPHRGDGACGKHDAKRRGTAA